METFHPAPLADARADMCELLGWIPTDEHPIPPGIIEYSCFFPKQEVTYGNNIS